MLVASGASTTLLLVVLPYLHIEARPNPGALAFALIPFVALIAALARPQNGVLTHLVFPTSHLPVLMLHPELTSREVYGGVSGLIGLFAVLVSFGVFLAATAPSAPQTRGRWRVDEARVWRALAVTFATAPIAALTLPALIAPDADPLDLGLAVALGMAVSLLAALLWNDRVPRVELAPSRRKARHIPVAPRLSRALLSCAVAVLALGALVVWSGWRP